jgi:hypothetical protein
MLIKHCKDYIQDHLKLSNERATKQYIDYLERKDKDAELKEVDRKSGNT